ncbi:UNVERIFIED_CONTAM: peptide maturation system acyl carrier-related protein [Acetivibrio alkalicellulosi]
MNINNNYVIEKLLLILKEMYNRDYYNSWEDIKDLDLLGYEMNFMPRDLIYLFFDVEKVFGIIISQDYVIKGSFSNLANIASMVFHELESKKSLNASII